MKLFFPLIAVVCISLALFSCAGIPARRPGAVELPPVTVRPVSPENIMGAGRVPEQKLVSFLERNNAGVDGDFIRELVRCYVEEAAAEGVNHDIAFAQMCLETGFLRYGGLVTPDMNNFCGLGAIGPEKPGEVFPDVRTGVRAHIQHLKAYASEEPLERELVDPRFRYVSRGRSPTIGGLAGTWAVDKLYSEKIAGIVDRLYDFSFL